MSVASRLGRRLGRLASRLTPDSDETTVAIACQGGGSHAAFTGGVLAELLADLPDGYRVVGLSGASGGAVCAAGAWYGLTADDTTPDAVLAGIWEDIAATTGWERWLNEVALLKLRVSDALDLSAASPYRNPGSDWGRDQLESVLSEHVDFEAFPDLAAGDAPALRIGAVDVHSGDPVAFEAAETTAAAVVASAAVPQLFEAVEIAGRHHWDGFLSQNPPIREFIVDDSVPPVDELWVIRLTPQATADLPRSTDAIDERSQQLVENLSLRHELAFVETVNRWVAEGNLVADGVTETTVRTVDLHREQTDESRLDRDASFIDDLYADGEAEAVNFLHDLDA